MTEWIFVRPDDVYNSEFLKKIENARVVLNLATEISFKDEKAYPVFHLMDVSELRSTCKELVIIGNQSTRYATDIDIVIDYFRAANKWHLISGVQAKENTEISLNGIPLFLVGKPWRINRLPLLDALVSEIKNIVWSLPKDIYGTDETVQHIITHLEEDCNWTEKYTRDAITRLTTDFIDNAVFRNTKQPHCGGYPYNEELYKNTGFSIISETTLGDNHPSTPWHTEKTWRAISNNHPFLLAAHPEQAQDLKSQGFELYEGFLEFNYFNDKRFDLNNKIVKCAKNWNTHMDVGMKHSVRHNRELCEIKANEDIKQLDFLKADDLDIFFDVTVKVKALTGPGAV